MTQGYCDKDCKGFTEGISRGLQFQCGVCRRYTAKGKEGVPQPTPHPQDASKFIDNGYTAEYVITTETPITNMEELRASKKIDETIWSIDRAEFGTSQGYRKDRKVDWHVQDGKVISGNVEDTGKMLVVTLHTVRVWVSRKTAEIRNKLVVNEFSVEALKAAPKIAKVKYQKVNEGHLFELGLPDMQLGRLVMAEEAGHDISPDQQIKDADIVVDRLLGYADFFGVDRILFPIGNDFFDTNSADMFTKHGTPQEDDVRWKRTYQLGAKFIVKTIEKLMQIAPVDVVVVPGNHDEDKIWHLGEYVEAWFNKSEDVSVDNRMMKRKYYSYHKDLIMLTHGYFEKNNKLDSLMAYEVPQLWANSTHREVHLGDKHHKVDMILKTNELDNGVVVRILRNLATPSVWEFDKGFVGALHSGEAFVWHEFNGVVAQFTAGCQK